MAFEEELNPEDEKRRQHLVRLLALGAMTMSPVASLKAAWWGSSPEPLDDDKSIFSLNGVARVNNLKADLDTRIQTGDVVRTGKDSEIVFAVGSDSFILRSNSEMEVEGSGFFIDSLRLLTGSVLSVFGPRTGNRQMRMNSPTSTIGIRGTGVYMEAEPDLTYLCTCYGRTEISSSFDPADTEVVAARHHDEPKYISNKANKGSYIRSAPFKNHTDAELKLLEAIVGREVPFGIESELYKGERNEY